MYLYDVTPLFTATVKEILLSFLKSVLLKKFYVCQMKICKYVYACFFKLKNEQFFDRFFF